MSRPPSAGAVAAEPRPKPKLTPAAALDLPEEVHDLPWEDDWRCGNREEELEDA